MQRRTPDLSPPSEELEQPTVAGAPLARRSDPELDADATPKPFAPYAEEPTLDAQAYLADSARAPEARRSDARAHAHAGPEASESTEEPTEDRRPGAFGADVPRFDDVDSDDSSENATRVMLEPPMGGFDADDESLRTQGAVPGRMVGREAGLDTLESRFAPPALGALPSWGMGGAPLPVGAPPGSPAGGAPSFPPPGAPLAPAAPGPHGALGSKPPFASTMPLKPVYASAQPGAAAMPYGGPTMPYPGAPSGHAPAAAPFGSAPPAGPAGYPAPYASAYPPVAFPQGAPAPAGGMPSTLALLAVGGVTILVATPLIVAALWFFLR